MRYLSQGGTCYKHTEQYAFHLILNHTTVSITCFGDPCKDTWLNQRNQLSENRITKKNSFAFRRFFCVPKQQRKGIQAVIVRLPSNTSIGRQ